MDNDTAGRYAKIVPPHGNVCSRRIGLPKSAAKMLAAVLNNTVYFLRTGYGESERTYCTDEMRRILGTGQGNGMSPCIWSAILDTILWSIAQKYVLFKLSGPSRKTISKLGDAYVDDTALMYIAQEKGAGKTEGRKDVTE